MDVVWSRFLSTLHYDHNIMQIHSHILLEFITNVNDNNLTELRSMETLAIAYRSLQHQTVIMLTI